MVGLLVRPVRTIMILGLAFLAGYIYAIWNQTERCAAKGGIYEAGLCIVGTI